MHICLDLAFCHRDNDRPAQPKTTLASIRVQRSVRRASFIACHLLFRRSRYRYFEHLPDYEDDCCATTLIDLTNRSSRQRAGVLLRFQMIKTLQPAVTRALARRG